MNTESIPQGAALKADGILEKIECLLTEKAKAMFSGPRLTSVTGISDDGNVNYVMRFFGVRTYLNSVGALKIAKIANEIAEKYDTLGVLSEPCQIKLADIDLIEKNQVVTVFYVAFKPEDAVLVENHEFAFHVGGVPENKLETLEEIEECKKYDLDTLDPEIIPDPPGTAYYLFRVSHIMTDPNQVPYEDKLQNEIDRMLGLLPKGTKHISTEKMAVTDLSIPYRIKFQNEIFLDKSEIKDNLEYFREISILQDNRIVQFNRHNGLNFNDFIKIHKGEKVMSLGEYKKEMKND